MNAAQVLVTPEPHTVTPVAGTVTMSVGHPTVASKPNKPYPEFPLYAHATKRWAKKIRGQLHYFGPWDDPDGALDKYLKEKDALHAGRKPKDDTGALTVKRLANEFLTHKQDLLDAGELSPRTWASYKEATDLLVARFGKNRLVSDLGQDDFAAVRKHMSKRWGPVRIGGFIQRIRSVFKYGYDADLMPTPMRFGPGFARPTKKTLRLERARHGPRMFEAEELRTILAAAGCPMKAMILLGVNCGFGNADCGTLPASSLDLDGGFVNYHRPKTGITRRCPLWPETVAALKEASERRQESKENEGIELVFVTKHGNSWHKKIDDNPISKEMRKLLDSLGINDHRNFYALRHTFETIGGEAKDQVAVDHIMGHARDDMASLYRERISDDRLKAVADHVRAWLFTKPKKKSKAG